VALLDSDVKREFARITTPTSIANLRRLLPQAADDRQRRMYEDSLRLAEGLGEVPVLILVCATGVDRSKAIDPRVWMGVYPAAQNLILAARALGLGTTLATYHFHDEEGVRRLLGLPADTLVAATIVLGWPAVKFGPVQRRPVSAVLHWDRW
jgi:nitroreductase